MCLLKCLTHTSLCSIISHHLIQPVFFLNLAPFELEHFPQYIQKRDNSKTINVDWYTIYFTLCKYIVKKKHNKIIFISLIKYIKTIFKVMFYLFGIIHCVVNFPVTGTFWVRLNPTNRDGISLFHGYVFASTQ